MDWKDGLEGWIGGMEWRDGLEGFYFREKLNLHILVESIFVNSEL
jgi:hypothetical protein